MDPIVSPHSHPSELDSTALNIGGVQDIGGVKATTKDIAAAIYILEKVKPTYTGVKQVLRSRQNPLWKMKYHDIADEYLKRHTEHEPSKGTVHEHNARVRNAVIRSLRERLNGLQQAADHPAYAPPQRGGEVPESRVFKTNPDKIDRGTTAHKDTQDALADALQKAKLTPWEPMQELGDPKFDIAWRDNDVNGEAEAFIGEVKSLTDENESWQIRLAIGQVLDYVHKLDSLRKADLLPPHWKGVHAVRGVVAVERQPTKVDHWTGLCNKHGIILTWPEKYDDMLASMH